MPDEHKAFQDLFYIKIPHYKVDNFLEMAEVIAGADIFMGNQTFAYSLAIGLDKRTMLEARSIDCIIQKENHHYF